MTAYRGGLALLRMAEHDRAAEIDPTARLTLAAMGLFTGSKGDPECFASHASIAKYSGLNEKSVRRALGRLEKLGIIERDGIRGKTVRWRLTLLSGDRDTVGTESGSPPLSVRESDKNTVRESDKNTVRESDNPSDSTESQRGRERKIGRSAPSPLPGGRGSVDATSTAGVSALALKAAERLGMSEQMAEKWVAERMADSKTSVRNPASFIETCIRNAEEDAAAKAKNPVRPKGTGAGAPAKTPSKSKRKKGQHRIPPDNERCQGEIAKGGRCVRRGSFDGHCATHDIARVPCEECGKEGLRREMSFGTCWACRRAERQEREAKAEAEREARAEAERQEREAKVKAEREQRAARGEVMLTLVQQGKVHPRFTFTESAKMDVIGRRDNPLSEIGDLLRTWGDLRVGDRLHRYRDRTWTVVEREDHIELHPA